MSKISDRLSKLGQTETIGFGFGVRSLTRKIPLILTAVTIHKPTDIKDLDADLFIISNGLQQPKKLIGPDIWGVSVSDRSESDIDALVSSGADFLLIEKDSAPGVFLCGEDTGKGFVVDWDLPEKRAKAVDNGPFDFLILDAIRQSNGCALAVEDEHIINTRDIISKEDGLLLCPEGAATAAGYQLALKKK